MPCSPARELKYSPSRGSTFPRSVLLAVLAPVAFLSSGCDRAVTAPPENPPVVRVMRVGSTQAGNGIEFPAEIRARYETPLAFRVGGKVIERPAQVGTRVAKGRTLARVDTTDLAHALDAAKAQRATLESERSLAVRELERFKGLREKGFVSQAELDRRQSAAAAAQTQLDAAEARLKQSESQLAYATLVADADGVITSVEAEVGQVVAAGQTIVRLVRPGDRELAIAVPESLRAHVAHASAFTVVANALPGKTWTGRLRELSPAADPVTRTYAARIALDGSRDELALGMSARVIVAGAAARSGVAVPLAAIHARDDKPQVWLVDQAGTVRTRPVVTRGIEGDRILVESGLADGDVVVVAGAQLLHAGQKVRVLEK
jgi:RND family efflux transporter MFP subunit